MIPLTCSHVEASKPQVSIEQRVAMVTWYNEKKKVKRAWWSGKRRMKMWFRSANSPATTSLNQNPRFNIRRTRFIILEVNYDLLCHLRTGDIKEFSVGAPKTD